MSGLVVRDNDKFVVARGVHVVLQEDSWREDAAAVVANDVVECLLKLLRRAVVKPVAMSPGMMTQTSMPKGRTSLASASEYVRTAALEAE